LAYSDGKLITVFGCGGNRDQGKRPLMAAIAEKRNATERLHADIRELELKAPDYGVGK
jgi:UDP-N-acetylmuramyl tripeptide synthase